MGREDLFKKAGNARKDERAAEAEKRNNTGGGYTEIAYLALIAGKDRVFRVLGNPKSNRQDGTDPKSVFISPFMLGDDDKTFRCVWPNKEDEPNWIMYKIMDKVMGYKWNSEKKERDFLHKATHPSIFNRVAKNNKIENPYETGWKPGQIVVANIIDRHDPEYHIENKHTKGISKKVKVSNDTAYYEPGVPITVYNTIWDDVVEFNGDWQNYDVSVKKLTEKPWYKAFHCGNELHKIMDPTAKSVIVDGPLTAEELAYEKYDWDKLFPVTAYSKIKKKLGAFIQAVDAAFKTSYYEELLVLVEAEKERKKQEKAVRDANKVEETPATTVEASAPITEVKPAVETVEVKVEEKVAEPTKVAERPTQPRPAATRPVAAKVFDVNALPQTDNLAGFAKLTDAEKACIVGIDQDTFVYEASLTVYECPECAYPSPGTFATCPSCGNAQEPIG